MVTLHEVITFLVSMQISISSLQRSEERFSRNAETDLVCRLLLEKKNIVHDHEQVCQLLGGVDCLPVCVPVAGFRDESAAGRRIALFFFTGTATTEMYTLSLHDALPIYGCQRHKRFYLQMKK